MSKKEETNLSAMILLITGYCQNKFAEINRTALNKLVFFSDLVYFLNNGKTISGVDYKKIDYGPVPENMMEEMDFLLSMDFLREEVVEDSGYPEYYCIISPAVIIANVEQSFEYFELETLRLVSDNLGCFSSSVLSNHSNMYEPWRSASWFDKIEFETEKNDTSLIKWLEENGVLVGGYPAKKNNLQ